jgi:hypothetical protein
VILTTTTLVYIEPRQDRDGRRVKVMLDMITEAWDRGDLSPYIHSVDFDRRLADQGRRPGLWQRLTVRH